MRPLIKLTFVLSLFTVIYIHSFAQQMRFGVFADTQISWFGSDTKAFTPKGALLGYNAGFAFEQYFADRYAVTTGLSLNNSGGSLVFNYADELISTLDGDYTINQGSLVKIRNQLLSVPLGLKFKTNEIGYLTIYADLGAKANIRFKSHVWEDNLMINKEVLTKDQFYFAYLSYYVGTGIQYSLGGPSAIQVGLTFSNGLTPLLKERYKLINIGTLGLKLGLAF
jgi:hypothetical protein